MEWKNYKLSEIGEIVGGATPSTKISEYYDGDIPWISPKDLSNFEGKYISCGSKNITELGFNSCSCKILPKGSVLFSSRAPIGYIAIAKNSLCTNQGFKSVIPNRSIIDSEFLYYTLVFNKEYIKNQGSGTTFMEVSGKTMGNIEVSIPVNLSDQRKIAGILSALDSKIENNNKINANLEAQAEALFKSWFVDFTPFKDQPFVDSELGSIPQGWKVGKLGDYCETICRGLTPKYNLDSKEIVLGQTCVRNNIVTLNNARKHQPKGKTEKKVQQWDTLINSTGIGSLGRVGIVYFDYNYVSFDSHITVVRATNPLLRPYIGRNLVSRQLEIENLAIGSTGQTELPRESVKSITLYIPTKKVLESFNCIIKPLSLKILKNIQENQRLAALRDTLLPKLMSGEIKL